MGERVIGFWNTETWTRVIAYLGLGGYPIWILVIALHLVEVIAGRTARVLKKQGYDVDIDVTLFTVTSACAIVFCLIGIIFSIILLSGVKNKNAVQMISWTRWAVCGIIFSFIYFLIGAFNGNTAVISVHILYVVLNILFIVIVRIHIDTITNGFKGQII